ncbi:TPA: hypothetical protein ACFP4U_000377 [Neisseria lactamica]|nr:hypothetical protein [Neisseria lactamica]
MNISILFPCRRTAAEDGGKAGFQMSGLAVRLSDGTAAERAV